MKQAVCTVVGIMIVIVFLVSPAFLKAYSKDAGNDDKVVLSDQVDTSLDADTVIDMGATDVVSSVGEEPTAGELINHAQKVVND
jgi:ferric-dicitrate binding protein FerR (iron transport regulator)